MTNPVGQAVPHESARGHVTGEAVYTDDLVNRFPRLLHAWPVLATETHALITAISPELALEEPGVVTVLTEKDVPGEADSGPNRHDEPLFPTEVMFHRQPLAWVLADTLEAARRGAARVHVTYDPLPSILSIDDAVAHHSFHSGPLRLQRGDASSELPRAEHRLSGELFINGQEHFYLETNAALAWIDETGGIAVQSSTQHPTETQEIIGRVLNVPRHQVTVECLRMGGAFGGKEVQANVWAAVAALGAWKTRRPVRVRLTRQLDMQLTGKRHPFQARFDVGFKSDGQLQALKLDLYSDGGWSLDLSEPILYRAMFHSDNCYYVPHMSVTGHVCRTHKTSQTAFRGFGGPQGMVVVEDVLARIAHALGLPPEEVRARNFYREGHTTHYGQPVKDADRIATIWNQLLETSAYHQRREQIDLFNYQHPHTKRGLAITPVKFGISFTATFFNQAGALVLIYRDGSIQVNHGGTEMGQGLNTKIRQIAAQALGVASGAIRLMPTRTDKVPNTSPTAASSGTDLNGAAVLDACQQLCARLAPIAAHLLQCTAEAVTFHDSFAIGPNDTRVSFAKVVDTAYFQRVPLFAQGYYRTPDIHFNPATGQGKPFHYYAYGAAVTEVEVDGFTGQYRWLRTDILQDVGDSLSPLVDRGQIEGGYLQGLGWLTLEELLWDHLGRLATSSASTYKLPSWSELPETLNVNFLERATEPGVVFGSKAVGEPPLMLAISAREAIRDAVAAFSPQHPAVVTFDSPATPERVFWAIRVARQSAVEHAPLSPAVGAAQG